MTEALRGAGARLGRGVQVHGAIVGERAQLGDGCSVRALAVVGPGARVGEANMLDAGLKVGADADITLVDLNLSRTVNPAELGSYADYSLYEGQALTGWPVQTIVRGQTVMANGKITGQPGHGHYLFRSLNSPTLGK